MIREDYVPRWACKAIPTDVASFFGINKSKINIVSLFEIDCITENIPVQIKFHAVPAETITFAAILERDYIFSPQCRDVLPLIDRIRENHELAQMDENKQECESSDIFQIDCASGPAMVVEDLKVNPRIDYRIREEVKNLFQDEYLEKREAIVTPPSDVELVVNLKHDQSISYRPRRLSYADKQKLQEILDNLLSENIC